MNESAFRRMNDLPSTHLLGGGTAMCAGCGGLQALQVIYDVLGGRTVFVNAAGCMTLLSVYPLTPFRGSWLYTAMASAPAGAQGVRDALDLLIEKGRMPAEEDLSVVALTGDGAAYGMGLSSTSGAIERGLDFVYVCYDNEGYGNTGQQASGATPHAARTTTSAGPLGYPGYKKDLFSIWVAHRPAYAATSRARSRRRGKRRGRGCCWHSLRVPPAGISIRPSRSRSAGWRSARASGPSWSTSTDASSTPGCAARACRSRST
jgi:pyruvate ferredoxin oxidoreductase beta subunit